MKITTTISGLKELNDALMTQLPQSVRGAPLRAAVTAAARLIATAAKKNVLVKTGVVKKHIRTMVRRSNQSAAYCQVDVGVFKGNDSTKIQVQRKRPIYIDVKKRGRRGGAVIGSRLSTSYTKHINDPYYWRQVEFGNKHSSASPFLRPALENNRDQAVARMAERLREAIDKKISTLPGAKR